MRALAVAFARRGYEVAVITSANVPVTARFHLREEEGMRVYRLPSLRSAAALRRVAIKEILESVRPDVVHAHNVHEVFSYRILEVVRAHAPKVVLTLHDAVALTRFGKVYPRIPQCGEEVYRLTPLDRMRHERKGFVPLRALFVRRILTRFVDQLFAVSDALRDLYEANGYEHVATVHNGIETEHTPLPHVPQAIAATVREMSHHPAVLFAGRVSSGKGAAVLFEAFQRVAAAVPDALLVIAAQKSRYEGKWEQYAQQLGIAHRVKVTGWLAHTDMHILYRVSRLAVVPSIYLDPFPTINLEAGIHARPVIATCFGGSREVVRDRETGFIVNPHDTQLLSSRLQMLLTNSAHARAMGDAAQIHVRSVFTLARQLSTLETWYAK